MRILLFFLLGSLLASCGENDDKDRVQVRPCINDNDCPSNQYCAGNGDRSFCSNRAEETPDLPEDQHDTPDSEDATEPDAPDSDAPDSEDPTDASEEDATGPDAPDSEGPTDASEEEETNDLCASNDDCDAGLLCNADTGLCQPCLGDEDCPADQICAEGSCTAPPEACLRDRFEPNDSASTATSIAPRTLDNLRLCSEDVDWYKFVVFEGGDTVQLVLDFNHQDGDLDLRVQDENSNILSLSEGETNQETIELVVPEDGEYNAVVYSTQPFLTGTDYTLTFAINPDLCAQDGTNNDRDSAEELTPGEHTRLFCQEEDEHEEDWYALYLTVPDALEIDINSAEGTPLDMVLFSGNNMVAISEIRAGERYLTYTPLADGLYHLRVVAGSFFPGLEFHENYTLTITQ